MKVTVEIDDDEQILDDLELIADINGTSVQEVARILIQYDLVGHMQLALLYLTWEGGDEDESNSTGYDLRI